MAEEFKLPDLGEGVEAGDVVQVMVSEGDTISAEQSVMEIETDKAVVEVPCPLAGKVVKVHVSQGDKVEVGATLLTVDSNGEASSESSPPKEESKQKEEPAKEKKAEDEKSEAKEEKTESKRKEPEPKQESTKEEKSAPEPPRGKPSAASTDDEEPIPAGPATRRLGRELGVDLRSVAAAYQGERLTEEHVKEYVKNYMQTGGGGGATAGGGVAMPALPDFTQWGDVERESLSNLQRKTAENLHVGWSVAPHVTQFDEVDITQLEKLRKRYKEQAGDKAVRVTVTAFVIKALGSLLKEFPRFNSTLDLDANELIVKKHYHIGMAVDTPAGLIVPVLRDVDQKSVLQIANEMNEVAQRTRDRKVGLDELKGGTFTVTNLGGIGGTAFTPVVNWPEVAILGMARTKQVPAVEDGELITRMMLPLCLSYDHRVVNGADGARFVRRLAEMLEDPGMLLMSL